MVETLKVIENRGTELTLISKKCWKLIENHEICWKIRENKLLKNGWKLTLDMKKISENHWEFDKN